jgi:hypothetical protein
MNNNVHISNRTVSGGLWSSKIKLFVDRQSWLFTGILPNGYGPPRLFCYDFFCHDDPIMVSFVRVYYKHCFDFSVK